jgi:hypothetical protein
MAEMRRCIGSAKFGIEAHNAPIEDFPKQASQKDGIGRMCRTHWNAYTSALRKASLERKAAEGEATPEEPAEDVTATAAEEPSKVDKGVRGRRRAAEAKEVAQEGASE